MKIRPKFSCHNDRGKTVKPLWSSQPKKYKIRAAIGGPDNIDYLSTRVLVWTKNSTRTVQITFDPALVPAIGRRMQYGIGAVTPAYIFAVKVPKGRWQMWAGYFHDQNPGVPIVLLWESDTKPIWVKGANSASKGESTKKEAKPDRRGTSGDRRGTSRRESDQCSACLSKCAGGFGRRLGECGGLYGETAADIQRQQGLMSGDGYDFAVPGEN